MIEERTVERTNVRDYLKLFDSDSGRPVGRLVDITADGFGVYGEEPLAPGMIITMHLSTPNATDHNPAIEFSAEVMWCNKDSSLYLDDVYDSGFKFVSLSDEVMKQLEYLIEDCSFSDW